MADGQLVCLSLIHPPQIQLYSRIYEILWRVFLPQMQLLGSSMEDPQIEFPSSEPKQIVHQIRQVAGEGMINMIDFITAGRKLANAYIELLRTLPDVKESSTLLNHVHTSTFGGKRRANQMQQHFTKVREELDSGLRRITVVFADDTPTEITEAISKLLSAIDELNELFQESRDYCEEIKKQTSDASIIESNPPSPEETQMMREKWGTFGERLEEFRDGWDDFVVLIEGTEIIQADGKLRYIPKALRGNNDESPPPTTLNKTSTLPYTLNANLRMDHSEGSVGGARPTAIPPDPLPTEAKTPFWRRIFQRLTKANTSSDDKLAGRDSTAATPSNSSPTHKPKISFWRKLIRYLKGNNSTCPTSESETPGKPDAVAVTSSDTCRNSQTEMNNPTGATSGLNQGTIDNSPSVLPMSDSNPT